MKQRAGRSVSIALVCSSVIVLVGASATLADGPGDASKSAITCRYDQASRTFKVRLHDAKPQPPQVGLVRTGDAIGFQLFGFGADCGGPEPTVFNTDTIRIRTDSGLKIPTVIVDLSGGPFAPGATEEPDGESEIEFKVDFRSPRLASELWVWGAGRGAGDDLRAGRVADGVAVNLNASEAQPDPDVTAARGTGLLLAGYSGDDRLSLAGGPGFSGRFPDAGGSGPLLDGGHDRDRLVGAGGDDFLIGGPGADRFDSAGGRDQIWAREGDRDQIACGPGRDFGKADRKDRTLSCEDLRTG